MKVQNRIIAFFLAVVCYYIPVFGPIHELGHVVTAYLLGGKGTIDSWCLSTVWFHARWQEMIISAMGHGTEVLVLALIATRLKRDGFYFFVKVYAISQTITYYSSSDFDDNPMSIFVYYAVIIFVWKIFLWGKGRQGTFTESVENIVMQSGIMKSPKKKKKKKMSNREAIDYQLGRVRAGQK